jgi:hypothetical protein
MEAVNNTEIVVVEDIKKEVEEAARKISVMTELKTDEDYGNAIQTIAYIAGLIKKIKERFNNAVTKNKESVDKARAALKEVEILRDSFINPLAAKRVWIETSLANPYYFKKKEAERIAQAKAEEEKRLLAEKEKEKLEKAAVKMEEKGNVELAEELREQAQDVVAQPVFIPTITTKTNRTVAGTVSQKEVLKAKIIDFELFIKEIAKGRIPIEEEILSASIPKLEKYINKYNKTSIPGIAITKDVDRSARGK